MNSSEYSLWRCCTACLPRICLPRAILLRSFAPAWVTFTWNFFADKAPVSVENFINYAKSGFYDGTIFHRVIAIS